MSLAGVAAAADGDGSGPTPEQRLANCSRHTPAPDGTRRQSFDAVEAVGGIAALPPRTETELDRGERGTYCVGFQNRGEATIDLVVDVADVAADDEGLPSSQRNAVERGASRWITVATDRIRRLEPGDVAWVRIGVSVPEDALGGSSYASIIATDATPISDRGAGVQSIPSVASQLFFDIPGSTDRRGEVTKVRSPRVIWWDGLDIGGLPILQDLRGLGIATIRFAWRNTGDYTSDVGGHVEITSDLSGKSVARLEVPRELVLRGSEREFQVTWSRDIPLVGRFTPVLEVAGDEGDIERHELEPIWVIPSWWYILLLVLAIALPFWWRRRSRRRYDELLARVEDAEARAARDEEWDDHDEWDDDR